ncbi:MAG: hypothetical protein F6K17_18355 [Okeania sp. SIO3C4]|nr:hypothetical protein [Okeania sp. SIO3C4]
MIMSSEPTNKGVQVPNTVILDFGSAKSDDVSDLCRGEGKVFEKISEKIEELKSSGEVSDNIQPIIVIFKKKIIDKGVLG